MAEKFKVIIRKCEDYSDVDRIRGIIREGIEALGEKPRGKVLLKPNLIYAHKRYATFGYTEPRVMEAIVDVLAQIPDVEKITIGERTALTIPTRFTFYSAGYAFLLKKPKVDVCFFDEAELVTFHLKKGTLHKSFELARPLVEADYKVWAPKLKNHSSTKITHAMKLNIGILNAEERIAGHDWRLEEKIADLYEAGHPDLVVSDSVLIGQQGELVPKPMKLGVMMIGNNGLAVDSVGARILGFEPNEIEHLRLARERGWPPATDDDIIIDSEVPLEELQEKTKGFDRAFHNLEEIDTPIRFFLGKGKDGVYCDTGCTNMLKTAFAIVNAYAPGSLKEARPVAVVVGEHDGDIDGMGLPIVMLGDCTKVNGKVHNGKIIKYKGCPVMTPGFMVRAPSIFKVPNPYFDPVLVTRVPYHTFRQSVGKILNRGIFKSKLLQ